MTRGSPDPGPHFEALARAASDAFVTITPDSTIRYANPALEDILGYPPEAVIGEQLTVLMPDGLDASHREGIEEYLRTGERSLDWDSVRLPGRHRDGHRVPLDISFSEFVQGETRYFTGIIRDATERERRERRLEALNELAQDLAAAEDAGTVCERAVEAARSIIDHPVVAIERYDDDRGRLAPAAWTPAVDDLVDGGALFDGLRSLPWTVFTSGEERIAADLDEAADLDPGATPLRSALVFPVGDHGVLIVGATAPADYDDADVDLARILAATVRSALERVSRTESLRERKRELEEQTAALERLRRVNDVIRDVTATLTAAANRDEVLREVCTRLADAEPFRFAWFGALDHATGEVEPQAWAGRGDGYLDEVTVTTDGGDDEEAPAAAALRTEQPQVQADLFGDPPFEPWRQAALEREFRSSIAIPVGYRDTTYGVLDLYAGEVDAFDRLEAAVLEELGETVGYVLNALERKQAFFSERSVELAFDLAAIEGPVLGLSATGGGRVEIENLVERVDGSVRGYFTVAGADPDAVLAAVEGDPGVDAVRRLTGDDDENLFECRFAADAVWSGVLARGATVQEARAADGAGRVVLRVPVDADLRAFDALFDRGLGDADLVARRETEEPVMTPQEFEAAFRERLTERQDEVLRTAYFAGFFEWPRRVNASELADILDISQPTVSRHLRTGERTVLSMVYD